MKILLDENFPLQLYRRLIDAGHDAEHIITLGQRGLPDAAIRSRLAKEEHLVFLTQDSEFEQLASGTIATVIISRISQAWPIAKRVELWMKALDAFEARSLGERLFELLETGEVVACRSWS